GGHVLGSGDPGDEGKALGVRIKLVAPLPGNLGAIVQVTPPKKSPAPHPDLRTAVTRGRPEPAPAAPTIVDHERTAHQSRAHSGDPEGSARGSGDQHSLTARPPPLLRGDRPAPRAGLRTAGRDRRLQPETAARTARHRPGDGPGPADRRRRRRHALLRRPPRRPPRRGDRKSTRLNSSHVQISYTVFW